MQSRLPYFKIYPARLECDEWYMGLSFEALGYYHRLLNHCWTNGSIPADPKRRCALFKLHYKTEQCCFNAISMKFQRDLNEPSRMVQPDLEQQRNEALKRSESASESVKHRYERTTTTSSERSTLKKEDRRYKEEEKSACAPQPGYLNVAPLRRALPPSKLNGHGAEWSAALYARHPKKKDEALVGGALFRVMEEVSDPSALFQEIDRVHRLWCATFDWSEKNGRFAPVLAAWLLDHGWTVEPHEDRSELERMMDRI